MRPRKSPGRLRSSRLAGMLGPDRHARSLDKRGQFATLLRAHRLALGVSQEELAERAGVSRRGIADLERGARRLPHPSTIRQLADALDLSPEERATLHAAAVEIPDRLGLALSGTAEYVDLNNLPAQVSSFVGRNQELDQLSELLSKERLLTLTGPGGVGKTRLAV